MPTRPSPQLFADPDREEIQRRYDELEAVQLDSQDIDAMESWLAAWSELESALAEASVLAEFASSKDVTNAEADRAYRKFSTEIDPWVTSLNVRLGRKLLDSGYSRPDLEVPLRALQANAQIFREENIPLEQELQELQSRYRKLTGSMTVPWNGEEVPIPRLGPYLRDPDRSVRERAWRLQLSPYVARKQEFDDLFDEQLRIRQQIARNAGYDNYRDYMFVVLHRFDYTPDDCFAFHDAVRQTFAPLRAEQLRNRQRVMGLEALRPWDMDPDPLGRPRLEPYSDTAELIATCERIFQQIDPAFGDYFRTMQANGMLDLESRPGKRPGGFSNPLYWSRQPLIFMNAAGTALDVRILLHEAGHAFHTFESAAHQPLMMQNRYGEEIAEVASMAMELIAMPYLHEERGGIYSDADHARSELEQLSETVERFSWIAAVDAFQHWLYTSPDALDHDARDAKWLDLWNDFQTGVDWSGLEAERDARWHRQLHIFLYPFYYIEYAIAQLGALQVWRNALADPAQAIANYRSALALGGTKPLPALYERAGARLVFDVEGMRDLAAFMQARIAEVEPRALA